MLNILLGGLQDFIIYTKKNISNKILKQCELLLDIHASPTCRTQIVKWLTTNLTSVYYVGGRYFGSYKYQIRSEKDEDYSIFTEYNTENLVDVLCVLNVGLCTEDKKPILINVIKLLAMADFLGKRKRQIPYDAQDKKPEGRETDKDYEASMDLNDIAITSKFVTNHGVRTLTEFNIVFTHIKKLLSGLLTDTCAENENFMYLLMQRHQIITRIIAQNYQPDDPHYVPFTLKGGNVFKLQKRDAINKRKVNFKHDSLSDWDFTVNIPITHEAMTIERNIFESSTNRGFMSNKPKDIIHKYNDKITYLSLQHATLFNKMWATLNTNLHLERKKLNVELINNELESVLKDQFVDTPFPIDIIKPETIDDVVAIYPYKEDKAIGSSNRSHKLYTTRDVDKFRKIIKNWHVKTVEETNPENNAMQYSIFVVHLFIFLIITQCICLHLGHE